MSIPERMADVEVRHRAGAREPRVDVDDLAAVLLRLHHPAKADRVTLGEVGAHDHDAVGVLQILLERRRAASTERDPQTGDRGGVSYSGLVFEEHAPESAPELGLDVVPLVVHGGAAERRDAERVVDGHPAAVDRRVRWKVASRVRLTRAAISSIACSSSIGSQAVAAGLSMETAGLSVGIHRELEARGSFGAEIAAGDRGVRVPLDVDRAFRPARA